MIHDGSRDVVGERARVEQGWAGGGGFAARTSTILYIHIHIYTKEHKSHLCTVIDQRVLRDRNNGNRHDDRKSNADGHIFSSPLQETWHNLKDTSLYAPTEPIPCIRHLLD